MSVTDICERCKRRTLPSRPTRSSCTFKFYTKTDSAQLALRFKSRLARMALTLTFMPSSFDPFMPKTRFQFPDGSIFSVGTVSCDDQIHQAGYLSYTPAGSTAPSMELELPPKSIEVIIRHLQERANEARFVNGERMLEYPEPLPAKRSRSNPKPRRRKGTKKATDSSKA